MDARAPRARKAASASSPSPRATRDGRPGTTRSSRAPPRSPTSCPALGIACALHGPRIRAGRGRALTPHAHGICRRARRPCSSSPAASSPAVTAQRRRALTPVSQDKGTEYDEILVSHLSGSNRCEICCPLPLDRRAKMCGRKMFREGRLKFMGWWLGKIYSLQICRLSAHPLKNHPLSLGKWGCARNSPIPNPAPRSLYRVGSIYYAVLNAV